MPCSGGKDGLLIKRKVRTGYAQDRSQERTQVAMTCRARVTPRRYCTATGERSQ
jgi:hypothetical protein